MDNFTKRVSAPTLVLLFFVTSQLLAASEPVVYPPICDEVEGISSASLTNVAQSAGQPWTLLHLAPNYTSGRLVIKKFQPNGQILPEDVGHSVSGTYAVTCQLGFPLSQEEGEFYWDFPQATFSKEQRKPVIASEPFFATDDDKGRYLLCLLHEKESGAKRFSNVHLVPDEWQADVLPAVTYFRAHPALLTPDALNGSHAIALHDALAALTSNPNPYIVLTAYQLLLKVNRFSQEDMARVLALPNTKLMASIVSAACLNGWPVPDNNRTWFIGRIKTAHSLEQLEGISLGISCAWNIYEDNSPYKAEADVRSSSPDQFAPIDVMMGEARRRLQVLYAQPLATDERAHAIDEVLRGCGQ